MAIQVEEQQQSRQKTSGQSARIERHYWIRGTASEGKAETALLAEAPTTYRGLSRRESRVEPIEVDENNPARSRWLGHVVYVPASAMREMAGAQKRVTFDTGGGTQHITQSISTTNSYAPAGKTAPNHAGAINFDGDRVAGLDIGVATFNFTVEKAYAVGDLPTPATLYSLTKKVNNAQFSVTCSFSGLTITLDAGECLLLGVSGPTEQSDGTFTLRFAFQASPNVTGLTINSIGPISKLGWEYLWLRYQDEEDAAAKAMVQKAMAAYVEKVYETGNFAGLSI